MHLQVLIKHAVPDAELKYKWRIPFYYIYDKPLCYFNVSHKKQFVDVGFWKGNAIQIHKKHHITENRKMMFSLRYSSLDTINNTILIDVVKEALSLY
jgi:hypothetical protein